MEKPTPRKRAIKPNIKPRKKSKSRVKSKIKQNPLSKKLLKVFGVFLVVLLIIQASLYFFGGGIAKNWIQKKVIEQSAGKYQLEFDKLNLNFVTLGFKVTNLKYGPTSTFQKQIQKNNLPFNSVYLPKLVVSGTNIFRLIKSSELNVNTIEVSSPKIKLQQKQNDTTQINEDPLLKAEKAIKSIFTAVNIKQVIVKNAKLSGLLPKRTKEPNAPFNTDSLQIDKNLSATITFFNFKVGDKVQYKKKPILFSEDIALSLENYKYNLKDKLHLLNIKHLEINTATESLIIENANLFSNKRSKIKTTYNIEIPKLIIKSKSLRDTWTKKTMNFESIAIDKPTIKVYKQKQLHFATKNQNKKLNLKDLKDNLYNLIKHDINALSIDSVHMNQANLLLFKGNNKRPFLTGQNIDCKLLYFELNSSSANSTKKIFYSDNLSLNVQELQTTLKNQAGIVSIQNIELNTKKGYISGKNFNLYPIKKYNGTKKTLNIKVPVFTFTKINFPALYNQETILFNGLKFKSASILVHTKKGVKKKPQPIDLYTIMSSFFKELKGNTIKVNNTDVTYILHSQIKADTIKARNINIKLAGIHIDRYSRFKKNEVLYSKHLYFSLNNFNMKMSDGYHRLKVKQLVFSSDDRKLNANGVTLIKTTNAYQDSIAYIINKPIMYDLKFPTIKVAGLNLFQSVNEKNVNLNEVIITEPIIKLDRIKTIKIKKRNKKINLYQMIDGILNSIQINSFQLNNGSFIINAIQDGTSNALLQNNVHIKAENFLIDPTSFNDENRIFFSKNIKVQMKNYELNLPDKIHQLKFENLSINSQTGSLKAKKGSFKPLTNRLDTIKTITTIFNINAPNISFKNIDLKALYHNKTFSAQQLTLEDPKVIIYNNHNYAYSKKKGKPFTMPQQLSSVKINTLALKRGYLQISNVKNRAINSFARANLNLRLNAIALDSSSLVQKKNLLFANNTSLTLKNISLKMSDSLHYLVSEQIDIGTKNGTLNARKLHYALRKDRHIPKTLQLIKKNKTFDIFLPSLSISGIDLNNTLLSKEYTFNDLKLQNPIVTIKGFKAKEKKRIKSPKEVFKSILGKSLRSFEVKNLTISNATVNNYIFTDKKTKKTTTKKIYATLKNLNISNNSIKNDPRYFLMDDFSLQYPSLQIKTKDSLYTLKTGTIKVGLSNQIVSTDSLLLIPRYGEQYFSKKVKRQIDRLDLDVSNIKLSGLDMIGLYNDNAIRADLLEIDMLNLSDYRNKKYRDVYSKSPKTFNAMLKSIKLPLTIKQVQINDGNITYEELAKGGSRPGKVSFNRLKVNATNLSNEANKNDIMKIKLTAFLNARGKMEANINARLNDKKDVMRVNGKLTKMNLIHVNSMLENVAFVSIKSGYTKLLQFDFIMDKYRSRGNVNFVYDNLKISVMKEGSRNVSGFTSFLANTFVIANNNSYGSNFRKGPVHIKYNPRKGPINYIWRSILEGIKPAMGINDKDSKKKKK